MAGVIPADCFYTGKLVYFGYIELREKQKYFPCHKELENLNCLFCYCPLYLKENCQGNPSYIKKDGKKIKVCTNCTFPHHPENYDAVIRMLKE